MTKVLLVGTFLSKKTGTQSVSEKLFKNFNEQNLKLKLVSFKHNKLLRIADIILSIILNAYDKMHIDTFSGQAFKIANTASFIGKFRRKRIILTLHGGRLPEFYEDYPERVKKVFSRADYIQTPSLFLKSYFEHHGMLIHYLPNPIDLRNFKYSREEVEKHSILWVRAFAEIYNPKLAVRILYEVKKDFPDATLTMVGPDKGQLGKTRELINELDLNSSIVITGPIPNELLFKFYQSHEVFINTTTYESFGIAVLEAAACGLPVVSINVGEIPYLWKHEENMLFVNRLSSYNYAFAIKRLFESENLAKRISFQARAKAEEFNIDIIKQKWVEILT